MRNCDLEFKLEDILPKFHEDLRKKILHSVDLIRKAEKLALAYDPEDGYFNTFSGGKDSQCLYHIVKMAGVKFKTHMNLTSVDPPEVIRFVRAEYPDVILKKPSDSIFNIAIKKGLLPTMTARWCCAEYKETAGAGKVTLIGIRHSESARRARRNEVEVNNHGYSGNLEGLAEYRKKRNSGRKPRKGTFSIINVNGESEVGCIRGKESLLISPIIDWTEDDVWTFLNTLGIKHCCLYDEGFTRIGCILCPMSKVSQKRQEEQRWPHVKRGWIRAIKKIRAGGVFAKGYIWWNIPESMVPLPTFGGRIRHQTEDKELKQKLYKKEKPTKQEDKSSTRRATGFSGCSSPDGLTDEQENEIAENIYDWWTSRKSYKKWYTDKFLSPKLDFDDKEKQ